MIYGHIYVFRHGQTYDNKNQVFSGWRDSKLTSEGKKQATLMGQKLKNKNIRFGFSSHLTRMKQTLTQVLKNNQGSTMIIDDRVIERCYGDLQGHTHRRFITDHGQTEYDKFHRGYDIKPPHGESIKMVEGRVRLFAKELVDLVKKQHCNVAVVCGNNSMRALRRYFEKLTIPEMMKIENKYNEYRDYHIS